MIREGQAVLYSGDHFEVGASGKVVAVSGLAAHVRWATGARIGQIDLIEQDELIPAVSPGVPGAFDDSLSEVFDTDIDDIAGVVAALDSGGGASSVESMVDQAIETLATNLMGNIDIVAMAARLDPADVPNGVLRIAGALVRDRIQD